MATGKLEYGIIFTAADRAGQVLATMAGKLEGLSAYGARLEKVGEGVKDARENIDAFLGKVNESIDDIKAAAAEVDEAYARLRVGSGQLAGVTSADLERARTAALNWSGAHTQSAAEYIAATNQVLAAGLRRTDVETATAAAMRTAAGIQGEAGTTATTLAAIYAQVGDKSKDVGAEFGRLGDQLTRLKQLFPR